MSLTLTSQANALLAQVIKQQGSLPAAVEQKLQEMGQAADAKPVTIEQVEQLCRDAMPSAAQQKSSTKPVNMAVVIIIILMARTTTC
jgi:transcriptional regulator NrdR family protein